MGGSHISVTVPSQAVPAVDEKSGVATPGVSRALSQDSGRRGGRLVS